MTQHVGAYRQDISRQDFYYMDGENDLMKFYRSLMDILDDFEFDVIQEEMPFTHYFTALPKVNPKVVCSKWKDPYTKIEVTVKFKFKSPEAPQDTSEDLLKVELELSADLVTEYPNETRLDRSFISTIFQKIMEFFVYRKEKKKYWEEAEEIVLEIASRAREIHDSLPAIGKSTREYYKPEFR